MTTIKLVRFALFTAFALVLAIPSGIAASDNDAASAEPSADSADFVYTTEYLKKRLSETQDGAAAVYTNETLNEQAAVARTPETAFTNDDLDEHFVGNDQAAAEAPTEPAQPSMTSDERAARIGEIDDELERLSKRMLAIRNPLLAGTAPATDEERAAQAGLDNEQRLLQTEAKIEELKQALEELRGQVD